MEAFIGIGTAATFAVAAVLLGLFFATGDRRFDRLAEWIFMVFAGLAVALAAIVQQRLSSVSELAILITGLGVVSVTLVGLPELLSALGRLDFQRYGWLAALGFAGWLVWIAGVSLLILAGAPLPIALGWLGLVSVAAGLLVVGRFAMDRSVIQGQRSPGLAEMAPMFAVFVALVAWLAWLGLSL